jgi:hypothetical protein
MTDKYVSHAHTPEELQQELLSDLRRRMGAIDMEYRLTRKGATEKSRIARGLLELENMLLYWSNVEIVRPKRKADNT